MLPFLIIDGEVKIVDKNGNIADIMPTNLSPDGRARLSVDSVIRGGNTPFHVMDVVENGGSKRALVEAVFSGQGFTVPTLGKKIIYEDFNTTTGGVNRGTVITPSWVTVFSKSGLSDGLFIAFLLTLEKLDEAGWWIKITVDGIEVFGTNGLSVDDIQNVNIYGYSSSTTEDIPEFGGLHLRGSTFRWEAPNDLPVRIESELGGTIQVQVRKEGTNRKFRAGLAVRADI